MWIQRAVSSGCRKDTHGVRGEWAVGSPAEWTGGFRPQQVAGPTACLVTDASFHHTLALLDGCSTGLDNTALGLQGVLGNFLSDKVK
jgi:hypothetical protein